MQDKKQVKIRTKQGQIFTITISKKTETHVEGTDKFGVPMKIPLEEIDWMLPITFGGEKSE